MYITHTHIYLHFNLLFFFRLDYLFLFLFLFNYSLQYYIQKRMYVINHPCESYKNIFSELLKIFSLVITLDNAENVKIK